MKQQRVRLTVNRFHNRQDLLLTNHTTPDGALQKNPADHINISWDSRAVYGPTLAGDAGHAETTLSVQQDGRRDRLHEARDDDLGRRTDEENS